MGSPITPERIAYYKQYLKEHPIDHQYDEEAKCFDAKIPLEQFQSRLAYTILKRLGELE